MHCLCRMCRRVLLVVLWLLIGTRSRLLVLRVLSIAEALFPSLCLFGTSLMTLCLMVWDWQVSRAEPMLSCWHDLFFIFCLLLFYLFLSSMGWLCGVGIFGLIECSHSLPALHRGFQIIIIIIIMQITMTNPASTGLVFVTTYGLIQPAGFWFNHVLPDIHFINMKFWWTKYDGKNEVPFSMAKRHGELMHGCFSKRSCMGTSRMKDRGKRRR